MAQVDIVGYVRGIARAIMAEGDGGRFQLTTGGEQLVANGLPNESELARQGEIWAVVGSAVAPVAAVPTTAAHLSLYNKHAKKSLLILAVGALESVSAAAAGQMSLLARNDVPGANADPAGALIITGTAGANQWVAADGNAKASVTLAAIGAGNNVAWVPTGKSQSRVAATGIGLNCYDDVYGRWIVRPGGLFSLATIAQTAAGSALPFIVFGRAELPF